MFKFSFCFAAFAALLSLACSSQAPTGNEESPLGVIEAPIKGGENESGWVGVGALTGEYIGWGYQGSFCSASAIAPQWVLTAAHCVADESGNLRDPELTLFYVGEDANPEGFGARPAEGRLFRTNALYMHPDYDPPMTIHDIALVHLAEPIDDDVPVYRYNDVPFDEGGFVGLEAFYVGFGVTDGVSNRGGGHKRSTSIEIRSFYDNYYSSFSTGTGVCFGDSGGPGMLEIDGEWSVIGVNSTVSSTTEDPCDGYSNQTRVDGYAGWIQSYLEGNETDCLRDSSLCWCKSACQTDGSCDNDACRTLSCRGGAECMRRCSHGDQACYTRCSLNATEEDEAELREMYLCVMFICGRQQGEARETCIEQNCGDQRSECYDIPEGTEKCRAMFDCTMACDPRDIACEEICYVSGTATAREEYDAITDCAEENCGARWLTDWNTGDLYDQDEWNACFYGACGGLVDGCRLPSGCDLLGGSCPDGNACVVTATGSTDCLPANNTGAAYGCSPDEEVLGCGDGLACVEDEFGFLCQELCLSDDDCAAGVTCETGLFAGDESVGVCRCRDNDHDGACRDDDCDDDDRTSYPTGKERCDDEADNDCDGEIDEGCEDCVDADSDGYCADVDCNDRNTAIHPGPNDLCGDGIDGNCNGEVDEGCEEQCTDADGDGFCEEVECDDNDDAVNPAALEICGDDIDNDCDGVVDEGCPSDDSGCTAGGTGEVPWPLLSLLLLGFALTRKTRTLS